MTELQRELLMFLLIQHGRNEFYISEFMRTRDTVCPLPVSSQLRLGFFVSNGYLDLLSLNNYIITDKAIQILQGDTTWQTSQKTQTYQQNNA
jgi:hypothetical protein